jgi:hypothetical protein
MPFLKNSDWSTFYQVQQKLSFYSQYEKLCICTLHITEQVTERLKSHVLLWHKEDTIVEATFSTTHSKLL